LNQFFLGQLSYIIVSSGWPQVTRFDCRVLFFSWNVVIRAHAQCTLMNYTMNYWHLMVQFNNQYKHILFSPWCFISFYQENRCLIHMHHDLLTNAKLRTNSGGLPGECFSASQEDRCRLINT